MTGVPNEGSNDKRWSIENGIESWYQRPEEKPRIRMKSSRAFQILQSGPKENRIEKKSLFESRAPTLFRPITKLLV